MQCSKEGGSLGRDVGAGITVLLSRLMTLFV